MRFSINWSKLVSVEVLLFAAASLIAFGTAWTDVKSDIAVLQTTDQQQEMLQTERYEDLKKGQEHLQDLIEQMLLQNQKQPNG